MTCMPIHCRFEKSLDFDMVAILKIFKFLRYVNFDINFGKISEKLPRKGSFDTDPVTDGVTV